MYESVGNLYEVHTKFHCHVEDSGIRYTYIRRRLVQLNGKVECSHRSDQEAFFQILSYKDDLDIEQKFADREPV